MGEIEILKANEEALALMTARALGAECELAKLSGSLVRITQILLDDRPVPDCYVVEPEAIVWQIRELKRQLKEAHTKLRVAVDKSLEVRPGGTI
jgi:hypothetical protein